ncbi:cytochrome c-type biogenesis protein CcmH [Alphaproteobacteria bacterium]|nr:cytochrome c-type biogenesis protein CcmH [Alphaproteobacteria bacterium]
MKMLNNICKFFFIFFFIFLTKITTASENQLFDYYKTIRCLVCDGQSIQESDTEFALNLKDQIYKKFNNGFSLEEINQELIKIYGEEISFSPSSNHLLLWFMPLLFLIIIYFFVRKKYKKITI